MTVLPNDTRPSKFPPGQHSDFVATVILASQLKTQKWGLKQEKDPALNDMRMAEMKQIIKAIISNTTGDGVILFPGGWFHSGPEPAHSLYQWASDEIVDEIKDNNRKIIITFGIDGAFDRPAEEDPYDKDQIALALDKSGIIAAGRKFFPGQDEGQFISVAKGYLENEAGVPRIFQLNGVRFFLFECNDIKAPYHDIERYKNPRVDVGLNLIHRINEKGQPLSQENNFACIFGARTSYQWSIPVFLSVIFFRNNVPEDWPSGVYCSRATSHRIGYDEIGLAKDSLERIPLTEGHAEVRVFRDIGLAIQQLKDRENAAERDPDQPGMKPDVAVDRKPRKMSSQDIPAGKYRPRFEEIIRQYKEIIPTMFRMHGTSSKSNWVVKANDLPNDLHYEFQDWNDKFSIELCLEKSRLPAKEAIFHKIAKKRFQNLPEPVLKSQTNNWLRLLFYFPEDTPAVDIANAMNILIDQSYPDLT